MGDLLPFSRNIPRTQDFGNPQRNAVVNNGLPHGGDDYGTPVGTPVRAAGDGVIDFAGYFDDTYADNYAWNTSMAGLIVWLNRGDDKPSYEYGHLSKVLVKAGDQVKRGQIIALTGASGGATGPHCHVGCLPPGFDLNTPTYGRVNPRLYMTDYWEDEPEVDDMPSVNEVVQGLLNFEIDQSGVPGKITLGSMLAEYRVNNNRTVENTAAWVVPQVLALREIVTALAVKQGVTIDYDEIARKVADETAKRLAA